MRSIPSRTPAMVLAAAFATLCAATGCSHPQTQPAAVPTTSSVAPVVLAPASPGKASSTIYLSDRLRQACGITAIESVKEAPKFDFDKNAILPEDRDVLAQVAQCLTTGALKGRSVRLVGRADPRGTQEYNMALGARRSNAVYEVSGRFGRWHCAVERDLSRCAGREREGGATKPPGSRIAASTSTSSTSSRSPIRWYRNRGLVGTPSLKGDSVGSRSHSSPSRSASWPASAPSFSGR